MKNETRREFLAKCGAGLAGIIASGKAPAAIVKSLVAARGIQHIEGSGDLLDVPYVHDHLIAMWDGEWNVGVEEHSTTSNPINLCGDRIVPLTWYGSGDIEERAFVLDSTTYGEGTTVDFRSWDGITFEYCVDYRNFGLSTLSGAFGWGGGSAYKVRPAIFAGNAYFASAREVHCWTRYNNALPIPQHGLTTATLDFVNMVSSVYNNGILIDAKTIPSIGSKISTNTFVINKWATINPSKRLALHSGRVHNRALSEDEVYFNYEIDKERFGL
jgi:hypothetical protein